MGSSGKTHCSGPGTCDPGSQERVAMQDLRVLLPGQRPSSCPPAEDAEKVLNVLPKRLAKYGLTLHPEKTRLVSTKWRYTLGS